MFGLVLLTDNEGQVDILRDLGFHWDRSLKGRGRARMHGDRREGDDVRIARQDRKQGGEEAENGTRAKGDTKINKGRGREMEKRRSASL